MKFDEIFQGFPLRGSCHEVTDEVWKFDETPWTPIEGELSTEPTEGFEIKSDEILFNPHRHSLRCATVSLRLGHATALTVHRTVIHSRGAASLPSAEAD